MHGTPPRSQHTREQREFLPTGGIRLTERRQELRTPVDLKVHVWGIDTRGERFEQIAQARDISLSGALLVLDVDLRSGDLIGVLYAGKKARYRVVWVSRPVTGQNLQAAVHRIAADECPWLDLLLKGEVASSPPDHPSTSMMEAPSSD